MKERTLKTKLLTVLLTLCMVLSIVPITAFAAGVNYIDKIIVTYDSTDKVLFSADGSYGDGGELLCCL